MQKQDAAKSLASARLPSRRDILPIDPGTPTPAAALLRTWQSSWEEAWEQCQSGDNTNKQWNTDFCFKTQRVCEILSEMVNADAVLNAKQTFWVREMIACLAGKIDVKDALIGNSMALAVVGIANYINSCHLGEVA